MARGEITLSEIRSQSRLWAEALQVFEQHADEVARQWSEGVFDEVVFTGCGSTYYLGVTGAVQVQDASYVNARAFSASELLLFPDTYFSKQRKTLLICVSRSGSTRETVEAARLFRTHGMGSVWVVTCDSTSPLAQEADLLIAVDAAQEQSRVQTRSFSTMAVLVTALAAALGGRDWRQLGSLPSALEGLMERSEPLIRQLGEDTSITQFAFLGSGTQYGLACEAMLKMTEMSRVFSVAYHILEYLHGPRYAADANTLIVGLVSDSNRGEEARALESLRPSQARLLMIADEGSALSGGVDEVLALKSGVPEWGRTILYLAPLQMLGWYQAVQRGFDPDNLPFDPRRQNGS